MRNLSLSLLASFLLGSCATPIAYFKVYPPNINQVYKDPRRDTLEKASVPSPFIPLLGNRNRFEGQKVKLNLPIRDPKNKRGPILTSFLDLYSPPEQDTQDYLITDIIESRGGAQSFLMVRNDSILYEEYFDQGKKDRPTLVFSMSKSFTATTVAIAIEEGLIKMEDPIQKYIPELKKSVEIITIRQLLNMRAGLKQNEVLAALYLNSKVVNIMVGRDIEKYIIRKTRSEMPPDIKFHYQSSCILLVAIAVQRAANKPFSQYMEEKLWTPLGMEYDGYWMLDSKGMARSFVGFAATTRDLAKLGRLYLNDGIVNGKRILPEFFVKEVVAIDKPYNGFHWSNGFRHNRIYIPISEYRAEDWVDYKLKQRINMGGEELMAIRYNDQDFMAVGMMGNILYVHPKSKTIIVRTGIDLLTGDMSFSSFFRALATGVDDVRNKYDFVDEIEELD